jgi:high frequency lysogenization protein
MSAPLSQQTLALAGLFQAARLVQQLAREGRADPQAIATAVHSLLALESPSVEAVFGGSAGLRLGLELLRSRLAGETGAGDIEIAQYVLAMIQLEGRLRARPDVQEAIRRGIEAAQAQMKFFRPEEGNGGVPPRLVEKLAELYTQTLSTLTPRIMVNGDHGYLSDPQIAARTRAALFAGIRSAFLWHQLGGRRWQLLFNRKKIAEEAAGILKNLRAATAD